MDLTPEQIGSIQGFPALPPNIPESLLRFTVFLEGTFFNCLKENGYDSTQHFSSFTLLVKFEDLRS